MKQTIKLQEWWYKHIHIYTWQFKMNNKFQVNFPCLLQNFLIINKTKTKSFRGWNHQSSSTRYRFAFGRTLHFYFISVIWRLTTINQRWVRIPRFRATDFCLCRYQNSLAPAIFGVGKLVMNFSTSFIGKSCALPLEQDSVIAAFLDQTCGSPWTKGHPHEI